MISSSQLKTATRKISSGQLSLKPDDAKKLKKLFPGAFVRIVLVAEVRSVVQDRVEADSSVVEGEITFDASEISFDKLNNQFLALTDDD